MSIHDFLQKELELARTDGPTAALKSATGELSLKALGRFDGRLRTPIWEDEWDVCLVLDACRHDLLESVASEYDWLPNSIKSAWSVGSASPEWINNTFNPSWDAELRQAGLVTANPFTGKHPRELGLLREDTYPLAKRPFAYFDEVYVDEWSDQDHTVDPARVTDRGMHAYAQRDEHGMERLVVHYMQPHMPFRDRPEWFDGWGGTSKFGNPREQDDRDIWMKLRDGEMTYREFWQAYTDNLRWVLDEVERWLETTNARVLVTSDHGNGAGEYGIWGHPPGVAAPALRRVPWVILQGQKTRTMDYEVPQGVPVTAGADAGPELNERLSDLGYLDEATG